MIKVKARANYGFAGTDMTFEEEFEDGTPDSEIEEVMEDMVMEIFGWTVLEYLKNRKVKNSLTENIATNGCEEKILEMEHITIQLKEARNIFGCHIHFDRRKQNAIHRIPHRSSGYQR